MFRWKKIVLGLLILFIDLVIYIFIGLVIMTYEDFYDQSIGAYWSLASMTLGQKIAYIGWYIWLIANVILILYFIYKMVLKYLSKK